MDWLDRTAVIFVIIYAAGLLYRIVTNYADLLEARADLLKAQAEEIRWGIAPEEEDDE